MSPMLDAFLRSWPFDPWLMAALAAAAAIYTRGWWLLRASNPGRWNVGRWLAFVGGLLAVFLALASPIEAFAPLLLQAHMIQHLLLMMIAPPLVWLGAPLFPLVRGLPKPVRDVWVAPCLRWRRLRTAFTWLSQPWVAWPIYVGTTWLWHMPRGYELALSRSGWHLAEHVCFMTSSLLFWYPVVRPYPSRPRWSRWVLLPYLILADVQNTVLAAWLTFAGDVLYPHYARVPRLAGISALDDQSIAGVIMWVPGSIAFLLPLFWIALGLLFGPQRSGTIGGSAARRLPADRIPAHRSPTRQSTATRPMLSGHASGGRSLAGPGASLPVIDLGQAVAARPVFDLLRVPLLGPLLRWVWFRPLMQLGMGVLAAVVIFDGLRGPQVGAMNLAGVLPWIHWRGLVVFGLLALGNVFCLACPFTLPRAVAGRWLPRGRAWPRALRGKWLAAGLVAMFLWSYETFSLWDNPWLTAWIALGYFGAALAVDGIFRGAAFCKYVCPIGQFNFVQSLVSPWEVKVRAPSVCATCQTKECIRGSTKIAGCQMQLFQPRKAGNLDCTFCLACVQACPHENVGVLAVAPGQSLWTDRWRSGIGRFSRRPDLAALVLVLVFGAFANAAGMVGPVVEQQSRLRASLGNPPQWLLTTLYYLAATLVAPLAVASAAAALSRAWGALGGRWGAVATQFSFALVPLGFAMWLAHYSFHFLTSWEAIVPAAQRLCVDLGSTALGKPLWRCACCRPAAEWVPQLEVLMLDFGLLLSLYSGFRISELRTASAVQALKAFAPWALLMTLLFAAGVWIVFQPMQMRGMLPAAG